MSEARDSLVRYRLARARGTLAEAELLAQAGQWFGCVNRLYYACFYAVTALLLRHGLAASKHSGVRALFNRHFVKSGIIANELGELFNDLFRSRLQGDYEDLASFTEAQVRPWLAGARRFVEAVAALLADGGQ